MATGYCNPSVAKLDSNDGRDLEGCLDSGADRVYRWPSSEDDETRACPMSVEMAEGVEVEGVRLGHVSGAVRVPRHRFHSLTIAHERALLTARDVIHIVEACWRHDRLTYFVGSVHVRGCPA